MNAKGKGKLTVKFTINVCVLAASLDKPHPQFGSADFGKNKNNRV